MREPSKTTHVVKPHDTLSAIALRYYGHVGVVPALIARNRLPKNGLIPVGARLALPKPPPRQLHAHTARPATPPHPGHLPIGGHDATYDLITRPDAGAKLPALPVAIKIPLEGKSVVQDMGAIVIESRLKGEIIVTEVKGAAITVDIKGLQLGEISLEQKRSVQAGYLKAMSDTQINYDPKANTMSMNFGFTQSTVINGHEFTGLKVELSPPQKFKFILEPKEVEGEFADLTFKGEVGFEVTVTFRAPDRPPEPAYVFDKTAALEDIHLVVGLGAAALAGVAITVAAVAASPAVGTGMATAAVLMWVSTPEVFASPTSSQTGFGPNIYRDVTLGGT